MAPGWVLDALVGGRGGDASTAGGGPGGVGGGGGSDFNFIGTAGGGGGSSFVVPGATLLGSTNDWRGDGYVVIAYDPSTDGCP